MACLCRQNDSSLDFFERVQAYLGDNAVQVDASEAKRALLEASPGLLEDGEKVLMAFAGRGGAGRDSFFFTSHRILTRNVRGPFGNAVQYQSIPYSGIKAYSIESAGSTALDGDCTLKVWSSGVGCTSMDFVRDVNIFAIGKLFDKKVLSREGSTGAAVPQGAEATTQVPVGEPDGNMESFLNWLGDDSRQLDANEVQEQLSNVSKAGLLFEDERVEMAFKCGRDSFLLTSKRILMIDVQGWSGKRVEYRTILWKCIRAFSIETAGSFFDRDAELTLFTNISSMPRIEQDFRKGKCDVMAIQMFIANKLLGQDTVAASKHAVSAVGPDTGSGSLFAWLGDDSRMIDAAQVDQQFHATPPILQESERVEMAFKGRRDMTLFTTKRLLIVDLQGWSGHKVNYVTFPWTSVQAFGVRSAGSFLDKDSEMMIWTDINDIYYPPADDEGNQPPPVPRNSYIEMDFQKDKVDLMAIKRYLAERCLRLQKGGYLAPEVSVSPSVMQASPTGSVEKFLNWIGDDARQIDATEVDQQLRSENPVLQQDEQVVMAFKSGRDMILFSTKRILCVDTQGFSGKKVEWVSVPYSSIRAFSVESAGSWDRDAEVSVWVKTYWMNGCPGCKLSQDLRKGLADIVAIQSLIAAQVIGAEDGSTTNAAANAASLPRGAEGPGGIEEFLSWIGDDAHEINADEADRVLHSSPQILQSDEKVDLAFKVGRDLAVFTTKRVLFVDVQGWTGKKVEYKSYPLKYCSAFHVQTAGMLSFLNSAEAVVYTDIPRDSYFRQDLREEHVDIWALQTMLRKKLLLR